MHFYAKADHTTLIFIIVLYMYLLAWKLVLSSIYGLPILRRQVDPEGLVQLAGCSFLLDFKQVVIM